jgi:hypothetical protein
MAFTGFLASASSALKAEADPKVIIKLNATEDTAATIGCKALWGALLIDEYLPNGSVGRLKSLNAVANAKEQLPATKAYRETTARARNIRYVLCHIVLTFASLEPGAIAIGALLFKLLSLPLSTARGKLDHDHTGALQGGFDLIA